MSGPVLVSLAIDPDTLQTMRATGDVVFAPVIRGTTIWSAGPRAERAVVISPNWFGVPERDDLVRELDIPVRRVDVESCDPAGCRHLVKALLQAPGVHAPHGRPTTNVAVILVPVAPRALLAAVPAPEGIDARELEGHPALPGGVRIEVRPGTGTATLARYAADVVNMIRGESAP